MSLSYPLWISRGWPYNKSFIDKACLVNIAGIILNLANILTSHLVYYTTIPRRGGEYKYISSAMN